MTMYNIMFGVNPIAGLILEALELKEEDIGRFRDAFVTEDEIAIYTRLGGGNRTYYEDAISALQNHPLYLRDQDDDFDSTYATFYFRIPDTHHDLLIALSEGKFNPDERWYAKLRELQASTGKELRQRYPQMAAIMDKVVAHLKRR